MRQTIEEWIRTEFLREYHERVFMEYMYQTHEMIYGVPCGPTLNMLPGRGFKPRGILVT